MAPGRKQTKQAIKSATMTAVDEQRDETNIIFSQQPTQNGETNQGDEPIIAGEDDSSSSRIGRKRGLTRGFSREKREKLNHKVFDLHFPPGKWGVVGKDADVFTTEVGIIVRMKAPLNLHLWKNMTNADKEPMFVHLASMFKLNFGIKHIYDVTDYLLQERYSDYRALLYKYIRSFSSIDEARKKPYNEIDGDIWNDVCDYVMSAKFQARSIVNARNHFRVKRNHCSGSKSFLRRREELKDKNIGQIEFYKLTHCKNEVWAAGAEEVYDKMIALRQQPTLEGGLPMTEDEICAKVIGQCERRKSSSDLEIYQNELDAAIKRADEAEKKSNELVVEVKAQQATIAGLNGKIDKLETMINMLASEILSGGSTK